MAGVIKTLNVSGGWVLTTGTTGGLVNADDITSGTITATQIADDTVTYAKMQNVSAASRLLGRGSSGGSGDPEEISLGTTLALSGTTLSVPDDSITFAKIQNVSAASRLLGRGSSGGSGDTQEITLSGLTMSGTTLSVPTPFSEELTTSGMGFATLTHTPISGTLSLYKNGLLQRVGSGNDYTLSFTTISWESGATPVGADIVTANYAY